MVGLVFLSDEVPYIKAPKFNIVKMLGVPKAVSSDGIWLRGLQCANFGTFKSLKEIVLHLQIS